MVMAVTNIIIGTIVGVASGIIGFVVGYGLMTIRAKLLYIDPYSDAWARQYEKERAKQLERQKKWREKCERDVQSHR